MVREAKLWILLVFLLFIYSYTQIDLGLTLTRLSFWQVIQQNFQYIGYFNRPLSTYLYVGLVLLLFIFYFLLLKQINKINIWRLVIITSVILFFAYNAFSYDLFNYIFDAKIVTFYHLNPYEYKALDFPGDPMLGFMHWTHRFYPYGPLWLLFTIPLSFLGFQKFLITFFLFKGLALGGYLLSCWSIKNITKSNYSLALFALNPLVLIESLVSAHNDILMIGLVLWGFYLLVNKKRAGAIGLLLISAGVKFATIILLPVFILKLEPRKVILIAGLLMILPLLVVSYRTELQPWYLLYLLPFAALMPERKWFFWPVIALSFGLLLHYVPYLYSGNWDPPIPTIKLIITGVSLLAGVLLYNSTRKQHERD